MTKQDHLHNETSNETTQHHQGAPETYCKVVYKETHTQRLKELHNTHIQLRFQK